MDELLYHIPQMSVLPPNQEGFGVQGGLNNHFADHRLFHVLNGCGIGGNRHTDTGFGPADGGSCFCILADDIGREALLPAGIHQQIIVTAMDDQRLALQGGQADFVAGDAIEEGTGVQWQQKRPSLLPWHPLHEWPVSGRGWC